MNVRQIWTYANASRIYGAALVIRLYAEENKKGQMKDVGGLPASEVSAYVARTTQVQTPKSTRCPRCNKASSLVDESQCLSCGWPKYLGSKKKNVKA